MRIFFSILLGIAGLIQGIDAALNLWERWKKRETNKPSGKPTTDSQDSASNRRSGIRCTQRMIDSLMFFVPWYILVLLEVIPVYRYLSVLRDAPIVRYSTLFVYGIFMLFYPMWIKKHARKQSLVLALIFLCGEFIFANYSFLRPSILEASWYPEAFALIHSTAFTGFRFSFLAYIVQVGFLPWVESLPKE